MGDCVAIWGWFILSFATRKASDDRACMIFIEYLWRKTIFQLWTPNPGIDFFATLQTRFESELVVMLEIIDLVICWFEKPWKVWFFNFNLKSCAERGDGVGQQPIPLHIYPFYEGDKFGVISGVTIQNRARGVLFPMNRLSGEGLILCSTTVYQTSCPISYGSQAWVPVPLDISFLWRLLAWNATWADRLGRTCTIDFVDQR